MTDPTRHQIRRWWLVESGAFAQIRWQLNSDGIFAYGWSVMQQSDRSQSMTIESLGENSKLRNVFIAGQETTTIYIGKHWNSFSVVISISVPLNLHLARASRASALYCCIFNTHNTYISNDGNTATTPTTKAISTPTTRNWQQAWITAYVLNANVALSVCVYCMCFAMSRWRSHSAMGRRWNGLMARVSNRVSFVCGAPCLFIYSNLKCVLTRSLSLSFFLSHTYTHTINHTTLTNISAAAAAYSACAPMRLSRW